MASTEGVSVEDQLQAILLERAMWNWLAAWRSLNEDCSQVQATAMKFQKLIKLAAKQIECYENLLKERQSMTDRFFKCIRNAREKQFPVHREFREVLDAVSSLEDELCLINLTFDQHQLQLELVQEKRIPLATKSQCVQRKLKESKIMNRNLRKRNLTLQAVKNEAIELYKSRDLMFDQQLIEMTQELVNTQAKTKAITDASTHLQTNIKQIQLQEIRLLRQLSAGSVKTSGNLKCFQCVLHYMRFLWECVASLALCPKLEEPYKRIQCTLVLF